MRQMFRVVSFLLIAVNVFLSAWFFINGDVTFHTDIARDFLLFEDIAFNRNITLLGPRSGGIPGVFHGPLWLYLNVPAYFLGGGNPVVVGWFWVLLFIAFLFAVYYVTKKMFNEESAWLATLLASVVTAESIHSLFNPFGAVLLFPVFFYLLWQYLNEGKFQQLLIGLFVLGLIIQFQMAFGGPILVIVVPLILYFIVKHKRFKHLLAFLILLIPLSTFLLFDLRNQFLQTNSVLNYLSASDVAGKSNTPLKDMLMIRAKGSIEDGLKLITMGKTWALFFVLYFFLRTLENIFKKKDHHSRNLYLLFIYLYFGYWLVTVPYKGVMWSYYYWPFVGLLSIFAVSSLNRHSKWFYVFFVLFYISLFQGLWNLTIARQNYFGIDPSSWKFHRQVAGKVFNDAPNEYGYYIFTTDQYGYPPRYAMNYVQRKFPNKKAAPFEKRAVTYLYIDPSTNPTINENDWKKYDIKIEKDPAKVFTFPNNNYRVEKYSLTEAEVAVPSNPNLIHTLNFR